MSQRCADSEAAFQTGQIVDRKREEYRRIRCGISKRSGRKVGARGHARPYAREDLTAARGA
jgi:hypothetical protein